MAPFNESDAASNTPDDINNVFFKFRDRHGCFDDFNPTLTRFIASAIEAYNDRDLAFLENLHWHELNRLEAESRGRAFRSIKIRREAKK